MIHIIYEDAIHHQFVSIKILYRLDREIMQNVTPTDRVRGVVRLGIIY